MSHQKLENRPVELSRWSYIWRRDREVQSRPEAYFIPRRLKRVEEVYRKAYDALGPDQVKSPFYKQDDIANPMLPSPKGSLIEGMLWEGGLTDLILTLTFKAGDVLPSADQIEARIFPTAWGWFGLTSDRILKGPEISPDGLTWVYRADPEWQMDWAYSMQVKAATELVCIFGPENCPVPKMAVTSPALGNWQRFTVAVNWGIGDAGKEYDFSGVVDTHVAYADPLTYSRKGKKATFECFYSPVSRFGNDSRLTVVLDRKRGIGVTVLLRDLVNEPIFVPEYGVYLKNANDPRTARQYLSECKKTRPESYRERVRKHPEAKSFKEIFEHTRLWRCPEGTTLDRFPEAPEPGVRVEVPDPYFQKIYEHADNQLRGRNMWGMLTSEVARPALAMEMTGLLKEADLIYDYFLKSPGIKSDGDFEDPAGSLEWAKGMRFDMGYFHEGTHSSTGKIMFSMLHRYLYHKDRAWLDERLPRIKQAADFIIREKNNYMKDVPNRRKMHVYGLMPPTMIGDYALPSSDWRWYYTDNAAAYEGLAALVTVLREIGDPDLKYYEKELERYRKDLNAALCREVLHAPVRKASDGLSHPFVPRMAHAGGLLYYKEETNVPQYNRGISDLYDGALLLGEPGSFLPSHDPWMHSTLDGMQEAGMKISLASLPKVDHPVADAKTKENEKALEKISGKADRIGPDSKDIWFWNTFADLPKISHNANLYLREDDIPNFLQFFFNHAVMMVGTNGLLWEHAHPNVFVPCQDPDNGTAGWVVENFRNMLVAEDDGVLWLAKGTPRVWLKPGCRIAVKDAYTYYGKVSYTIERKDKKVLVTIDLEKPEVAPQIFVRVRLPKKDKVYLVAPGTGTRPGMYDEETWIVRRPKKHIVFELHLR